MLLIVKLIWHLTLTLFFLPDQIMTPGIYVDRIIHYPAPSKHIEQRTTRPRA